MSHGCRLGSRLPPIMAALATLAVGACATKPPPPPAPVAVSAAPPEKLATAPRAPSPPKPVDLRWAFSTNPDTCTALASGRGGSLQIQTTTARQILVTAHFTIAPPIDRPRSRPAKLNFNGPSGTWSVPGAWHGRDFASSTPLDERGVASLLGLLGGGTFDVTAGPQHLGTARLPAASEDGTAWVMCPKQMMTPS